MALSKGFARNNAKTPLDQRLADMATIVCNTDGSPRVGVLGSGNPSIVSHGGGMNLAVAAAEFVTSKGKADGVMVFTNDGSVNVLIGAAPASNSRIDVLWVKHFDDTTGDTAGQFLPLFGVTAGVAAASPMKPAIPTGALELATIRIYSGTTATNGGSNTLVNTYHMTASRGGSVPFRTKADLDLWTTASEGQSVVVLATGDVYTFSATKWILTKQSVAHAVMRRTNSAISAPFGSYGNVSANAAWTSTNGLLLGCTYSNGIVIQVAGWYRVFWTMWVEGLPSGLFGIAVNTPTVGAPTLHALAPIVSNVIGTGGGSGEVYLNAGDVLTLWGYGHSGGMALRAASTYEPMNWGCERLHP